MPLHCFFFFFFFIIIIIICVRLKTIGEEKRVPASVTFLRGFCSITENPNPNPNPNPIPPFRLPVFFLNGTLNPWLQRRRNTPSLSRLQIPPPPPSNGHLQRAKEAMASLLPPAHPLFNGFLDPHRLKPLLFLLFLRVSDLFFFFFFFSPSSASDYDAILSQDCEVSVLHGISGRFLTWDRSHHSSRRRRRGFCVRHLLWCSEARMES